MNITKLISRVTIIAVLAFAFWFVGAELLFSLSSSIVSPTDFVSLFIIDVSIVFVLGIVYGVLLIRMLPGLVPFIIGTIAGWSIYLATLLSTTSVFFNLAPRVAGLALFSAPGLIMNVLLVLKIRSMAAKKTRAPAVEVSTTKTEVPEKPQTSIVEATAPAAGTGQPVEKPVETVSEQPVSTVEQPEKPQSEMPKALQLTAESPSVDIEEKSKSESDIVFISAKEQLIKKPIEEKIIPAISEEDLEERLLELIEKEGITDIVPLPSNLSPEGGFYPDIEEKLAIDTSKLLQLFKSLTDRKILRQSGVEFKKVVCPRCLSALNIINLGCPFCKSINITRQRILQHEACGFLGPEERFTESGKTICPRCGAEVEIIRGQAEEGGKDILKIHSTLFTCNNCNEVSTEPYVSFRCLTCGLIYDLVSFESKSFYRYSVNLEELYKALELKKPIKIIVEEMSRRGIDVYQQVMITGASRVPHKVSLLFKREEKIVGGAVIITDKGESHLHEIMRVLVLRTDAGLRNLFVLSYYKLDDDARKLAQFNEIPLIEDILRKDVANEVLPKILESILES